MVEMVFKALLAVYRDTKLHPSAIYLGREEYHAFMTELHRDYPHLAANSVDGQPFKFEGAQVFEVAAKFHFRVV